MSACTLSWFELFLAAQAGVIRQIEALKRGRVHRYGFEGDGWAAHINGASAEMAAAKVLGAYWNALARDPRSLPGDVGAYQVRWRARESWDLIVHPDDPDDAVFVLVVGTPPTMRIVGTILGAEAKRPEWWKDPAGGRPAYFVPQAALDLA